MANQQDSENLKKDGSNIINEITQNLIDISTCKINFFCFWEFLKSIKKYENTYLDLTKRVVEYSKKIDSFFPISLAQQVDTVYRIPIFNLQRELVQNLLHEFASNISSKKMQFNFLCSLVISILAIVVATISLIVKK